MYLNAGASQRVQDHSPGLGGRGILIGVESLQAPWPAHQPAAGGRRLAALTAPRSTYGDSLRAEAVL